MLADKYKGDQKFARVHKRLIELDYPDWSNRMVAINQALLGIKQKTDENLPLPYRERNYSFLHNNLNFLMFLHPNQEILCLAKILISNGGAVGNDQYKDFGMTRCQSYVSFICSYNILPKRNSIIRGNVHSIAFLHTKCGVKIIGISNHDIYPKFDRRIRIDG